MKLYIRVVDGAPYLHPVVEENLLQIHPEIDVNNLPEGWLPFQRVERPLDLPQNFIVVATEPTYVLEGALVKDSWAVRDMTLEEKQVVVDREILALQKDIGKRAAAATNALQSANDTEKVLLESYLTGLANMSLDNPFSVIFPRIDPSLFSLLGIPETQ